MSRTTGFQYCIIHVASKGVERQESSTTFLSQLDRAAQSDAAHLMSEAHTGPLDNHSPPLQVLSIPKLVKRAGGSAGHGGRIGLHLIEQARKGPGQVDRLD